MSALPPSRHIFHALFFSPSQQLYETPECPLHRSEEYEENEYRISDVFQPALTKTNIDRQNTDLPQSTQKTYLKCESQRVGREVRWSDGHNRLLPRWEERVCLQDAYIGHEPPRTTTWLGRVRPSTPREGGRGQMGERKKEDGGG